MVKVLEAFAAKQVFDYIWKSKGITKYSECKRHSVHLLVKWRLVDNYASLGPLLS